MHFEARWFEADLTGLLSGMQVLVLEEGSGMRSG